MLLHWIWLAHKSGVSGWLKWNIVQHFQDAEDVFFAEDEALKMVEGITEEAVAALREKDLAPAEKILRDCSRHKLNILTIRDAAYPSKLKNIPDPPLVLYCKGRIPDFDSNPVIGVVGTRRASVYGLTAAKRMGYQIGKCGGILVSGMAKGIDAMAMSGALTAGQPVVGVLGCGADIVYPAGNRTLFEDVENYGCILSEFAPGTPAFGGNFPKRNRIISGLGNGVLVVEAPERSGALNTARWAAEQGRDVFVAPGNIDQISCVGSNSLLRDGAIAVSSGWDVLSEYQALYPDKIRKDTAPVQLRAYPDEAGDSSKNIQKSTSKVEQKPRLPKENQNLKEETEKKSIDKTASSAYIDVNEILPKLSEGEQKIVLALKNGQRLVDDVIAETGLTTGKLLSSLTMLELKGIIRRLPGKRIELKL